MSDEQDSLVKEARERYAAAGTFYRDIRTNAFEDLEFRAGRQWPDHLKLQREADQRPCLTNNRLPQFVRQVTNELRQNMLALRVAPNGEGARQDTAEILKGLFKAIENSSTAEAAYVTAFESAVQIGFGYIRVVTEYESPTSFNQVLKIKRVRNSFSVTLDHNATELDGSDAKWAFVEEMMPKSEFNAKYPDSNACTSNVWGNVEAINSAGGWFTQDNARIVEYFRIVMKSKTLAMLEDGTVMLNDIAKKLGHKIVRTRETEVPEVEWYKLNGLEVLEKTVFPGFYIPIIPVYGAEIDLNGELVYEGIIRNAKDSQRMYNYWLSAETETISLAPKAPVIGAEGQFDGDRNKWESVNRRNYSHITYTPQSLNGTVLPPPYRLNNEANISAITQARMGATEDMKAATGVYTAALGQPSSEQTGKAINARVGQSQLNNAHFNFNLGIAYKHVGRVLLSAIPYIYDTPRVVRIMGDGGDFETVEVNKKLQTEGVEKFYDLTVGMYDVYIDAGPAFATRRREAVDALLSWNQTFPQLSQIGGDLVASAMDWSGSRELSMRLKKMLPPEINGGTINPQQLMQENEALKQELAQLQEVQMKIASQERIAAANNETKLTVAEINAFKSPEGTRND